MYPVCVGHELAGTAVKVGKNVKHIKVGDRVGIGAQSSACLDCEDCLEGMPQYCSKGSVGTYNGKYPDGSKSYGGYADYCRAPAGWAVKIPDELTTAEAAPMLCGGITMFNPLTHNGAGPGKRVGIVGFGGLGHFGVLFAVAMKCDEVVVISRSRSKEEDARKMGVKRYIATEEDGWAKKNARSLDLIISTVSSPQMPLSQYLQLLRTNGQFIQVSQEFRFVIINANKTQVGAPEDKIPAFNAFALITKGAKLGGSSTGSPKDIANMLDFAAKNKVHTWVNERPLKDANQAIIDMENNKARYRYVLVNEKHAAEEKR
jgi:D-arabinose 1-dehydrogenase-like Zn-dependent alcohol dehydrogenase